MKDYLKTAGLVIYSIFVTIFIMVIFYVIFELMSYQNEALIGFIGFGVYRIVSKHYLSKHSNYYRLDRWKTLTAEKKEIEDRIVNYYQPSATKARREGDIEKLEEIAY